MQKPERYSIHDALSGLRRQPGDGSDESAAPGFPPEFLDRDSSDLTEAQLPLWDKLLRAAGSVKAADPANDIARSEPAQGAVMHGRTGAGKTMMATMIAHFCAATVGMRPAYINAQDMACNLRGLHGHRLVERVEYQALADPLGYPLLLIDDFGAHTGNAEASELAAWMLYTRARPGCFTLLTLNKNVTEFLDALGDERLESRLRRYAWISFEGLPDYRMTPPRKEPA